MDEPILEQSSYKFSQDGNCLSGKDDCEFIEIDFVSDLGIDRDEGGFYVLKTDKWSISNEKDLRILFDRIEKIIKS